MNCNQNDYYFSKETGLSTIQEAYASSSQSQSQSNNSQQISVVSANKEGIEEGEEGGEDGIK